LVVEDRARAEQAAGQLVGGPGNHGWWHPAAVAGDGSGGVLEVIVRAQLYHGHRAMALLEAVG